MAFSSKPLFGFRIVFVRVLCYSRPKISGVLRQCRLQRGKVPADSILMTVDFSKYQMVFGVANVPICIDSEPIAPRDFNPLVEPL
jgi:hypothetical protein